MKITENNNVEEQNSQTRTNLAISCPMGQYPEWWVEEGGNHFTLFLLSPLATPQDAVPIHYSRINAASIADVFVGFTRGNFQASGEMVPSCRDPVVGFIP